MERIRRFAVGLIVLVLCFSSVAHAEERSAKEYMAEGIREAYDNMHLIYQAYYDEEGKLEEQPAGHVAIWQEWDDEGNLLSRTYLGADGLPMNRIDGYSKVTWIQDENETWNVEFFDVDEKSVELMGLNLAMDVGNGVWSEWITPTPNMSTRNIYIGIANLGKKQAGDAYTCQVEVEFRNVKGVDGEPFCFRTQGRVDDEWSISNVWDPTLIWYKDIPENTSEKYISTRILDSSMANASVFEIAFRCDNWESGSFRIRNIIIEKGDSIREWSPGI